MIKFLKLYLVIFLCCGFDVCFAQANDLYLGCFTRSGAKYGIDPKLLFSIAKVESNLKVDAMNSNRNGSIDIGLMQINSFWFEKLDRFNISVSALKDPCTNIEVGAWILAQNIKQTGNNWNAVGAYNAGFKSTSENKRRQYAIRVHRIFVAHPNFVRFQ